MADRTAYPMRLVTPEGVEFEGDVTITVVTGTGGNLGILNRHHPIVADLKMGTCKVELEDGSTKLWATSEGFATAHDSTAMVLVEEAVPVEKIDLAAADALIAEHSNRVSGTSDMSHDGEHDIYSSDVDAAEKSIAWGEHLKALHAEHVGS